MRVYGILEGVIDNTWRYCDPAIHMFDVCKSGFRSEQEAAQSLIDTGWTNAVPNYVKLALGTDVWVRPDDEEPETDEDGMPINNVRYIFEMEVD